MNVKMFRSSIYRLTRTERRSIVLIVPGLLWFGPLCTVFFLGTLSLTRSVSPLECDGPVNVVRRTPHCDGALFLGRLPFFVALFLWTTLRSGFGNLNSQGVGRCTNNDVSTYLIHPLRSTLRCLNRRGLGPGFRTFQRRLVSAVCFSWARQA